MPPAIPKGTYDYGAGGVWGFEGAVWGGFGVVFGRFWGGLGDFWVVFPIFWGRGEMVGP